MTATVDLSVDEVRATLGLAHDTWERVIAVTRSASRRVRIAELDVDIVVAGDELRCHRSEYTVKLVRLGGNGFFDALRSKLKWGER